MQNNDEEVDTPSPEEMKEIIASLSPSERAMLADPNFISEDEADVIMSERSYAEGGLENTISADELFARCGISQRRAKV